MMADHFESFLAEALSPPARGPDRRFVARVEARVKLEARLEAERRSIVRRFGIELVALLALAAGLAWAARAQPIMALAAESPWLLMCALLSIFGLLVVVLSSPGPVAPSLARMKA
jgi:hypothetical protein